MTLLKRFATIGMICLATSAIVNADDYEPEVFTDSIVDLVDESDTSFYSQEEILSDDIVVDHVFLSDEESKEDVTDQEDLSFDEPDMLNSEDDPVFIDDYYKESIANCDYSEAEDTSIGENETIIEDFQNDTNIADSGNESTVTEPYANDIGAIEWQEVNNTESFVRVFSTEASNVYISQFDSLHSPVRQ